MADIHSKSRGLSIKKYERDKMVCLTNIQSREIRIMELEEEIARNRADIDAQNKQMKELDLNIQQQEEEIKKEAQPKE